MEVVNSLPRYYIAKAKIELPLEQIDKALKKIPSLLPDYERIFKWIKPLAEPLDSYKKKRNRNKLCAYAEVIPFSVRNNFAQDILNKLNS